MLGAAGNDDVRWGIGQSVVPGQLAAYGILQIGQPGYVGILGQSLLDGVDRRRFGVIGRIQIGFSRAEAQHVLAFGLEPLVLGVDGDRLGRGDPSRAGC